MPPSRRQPPRSTPPVRRPRVAGLHKPQAEKPAPAEQTGATERVERPAPRPRPVPRPVPRPAPRFPDAEGFEESKGLLHEPEPAEDTTVFPAVDADPLTGEEAPEKPSRPSPRPKTRDRGRAKPVDVEEAEEEIASASALSSASASPGMSRVRRSYLLAGVLVVVGLLLAGAAVVFKLQGDTYSDATSNTALLDVAKTAQVKDQMTKAVETLFSYDYKDIAKTDNAAKDLLVTDKVRGDYDNLMGQVKKLAPQQQMVVTCKVTRSAVIMIDGDLAKVMLFVDQTSTRADTKKTTAGSAQLHVNAQLQGTQWKITGMDTYTAPSAPSASPSPPPSK